MKIFFTAFAMIAVVSTPLLAAEEWGLPEEKIVRFEAKVVDILCELTGDCPAACGEGKRQLGLLNKEGKLVLPLKNSVIFAGVSAELIDFCGQQVLADGLLTTNRGYTVMALQFVKPLPDGKWRRANRFLPKWAKKHGIDPASKQAEQWYHNDPTVKAILAKDGKFGLGPKADREYEAKQ